jgi:hypothetical protein
MPPHDATQPVFTKEKSAQSLRGMKMRKPTISRRRPRRRPSRRQGRLRHKAFGSVYKARLVGKRLKKWNRKIYHACKYAIVLGVLVLIFYRAEDWAANKASVAAFASVSAVGVL